MRRLVDHTKSEVRTQLLDQRHKSHKTGATHSVMIGNKLHQLEVFNVKNDVPKFRLQNGRIRHQILKLESDAKSREILKDPTSAAAQDLIAQQLEPLLGEKNLDDLMKKSGVQQSPLLLTHDGIVVNGNRRLAYMRKVNFADGYVEVARLPEGTDELEIRNIEMTLQMAEEGKSEYAWINQILTIRDNLREGMTEKQLIDAMVGHKPADVKKMIRMVSLIDDFLKRRGTPEDYSSIGDQKYFFLELQKHAEKHKAGANREALLWAAVNYFDHSPDDSSQGRSFLKINQVGKHLPSIVKAFGQDPVEPAVVAPDSNPLSRISRPASPFASLSRGAEVAKRIHEVVNREEIRASQEKDAAALFDLLKRAATSLAAAEGGAKTGNLEGISQQIAAIEKEISRLKKWLAQSAGEKNQ